MKKKTGHKARMRKHGKPPKIKPHHEAAIDAVIFQEPIFETPEHVIVPIPKTAWQKIKLWWTEGI